VYWDNTGDGQKDALTIVRYEGTQFANFRFVRVYFSEPQSGHYSGHYANAYFRSLVNFSNVVTSLSTPFTFIPR
jgi:hypothetical protein